MAEAFDTCEKCENRPGDIFCSCGAKFCEPCFTKNHSPRNPTHRKGGNRKAQEAWNWISGKLSNLAIATQFKDDEAAKWFGLYTEITKHQDRITSIVETQRLSALMAESTHYRTRSPRRQYPSITSFVGETGAGKSTLVRSLIYHSEKAKEFDPLEAPVPGASSGSSAILSTTGEVNLYIDPTTFGTESPKFYADCEGMLGTEPVAALHQNEWGRNGKRHLIVAKANGKPMDRRTAVQTLYPRFLYIFSDVICYVTRNHKAWADSTLRLLEWSMVGAQSTINQHALPALIIILNGSTLENEDWVSGKDPDAATKDFFRAIEQEISENSDIRALAQKHGDQSMKELFDRSFSSVYVHYVPLEGYKSLGSPAIVIDQTTKLAHRIRSDSQRVQASRAESWTKFDTRQLSFVVNDAFAHLASGKTEPFDFSQCRQQLAIPASTEEHFSEVLGYCLQGQIEKKFQATCKTLASSLLRHTIYEQTKDSVLHPSIVFNKEIRDLCVRAVSQFLDQNAQCAFVDPNDGQKCVNTRMGHAQGHQNRMGKLLKAGGYVSDNFDSQGFVNAVEKAVSGAMGDIDKKAPSSRREWRRYAAEVHRENLTELRSLNGFPRMLRTGNSSSIQQNIRRTSVCYGCFFGQPEYRLPCNHIICVSCIEDFDESPKETQYPGSFTHRSCIICAANSPGWPYKVRVKPDLAGVRVLSLDGGGVRGIVELVVLQRLESLIGLGLPLGRFFDLMVGTSAGGIIALGLSVQDRNVSDCITRFREFIDAGFKSKAATKAPGIGWLARWFRGSIYRTEPLELGLQKAFNPGSHHELYGLRGPCRVAVTTTVGSELKLIANYNRGGKDMYLSSQLHVWHAARCTSAAPMFFEHTSHAGCDCRDGGLKANNPIQHAVNESKSIWGKEVDFDLLLSVGPGRGDRPQKQPTSRHVIPQWLTDLLKTLLSTMDGQTAWEYFNQSADHTIRDRATRLNVKFENQPEPALDDIGSVPTIESIAENHNFYNPPRSSDSPFAPILGRAPKDLLECLAIRLRASMFFFQMEYMEDKKGMAVIGGWICCRLAPDEDGFKALMRRTKGFEVAEQRYEVAKLSDTNKSPFKVSVLIKVSKQKLDKAVRIDVDFGLPYKVGISGFPMKLRALLDYGNEHSDNLQGSEAATKPEPVELEANSIETAIVSAKGVDELEAISISVAVVGGQ